VVSSRAVFGVDAIIGQQVTFSTHGGVMLAPKIGNRIYISAGAKIMGPVVIGDDAVFVANAVVTKHVPNGATVVGTNRIITKHGTHAKEIDSQIE
jgi:serine O-acetyltransferase